MSLAKLGSCFVDGELVGLGICGCSNIDDCECLRINLDVDDGVCVDLDIDRGKSRKDKSLTFVNL